MAATTQKSEHGAFYALFIAPFLRLMDRMSGRDLAYARQKVRTGRTR